jgi:hypothetical protein
MLYVPFQFFCGLIITVNFTDFPQRVYSTNPTTPPLGGTSNYGYIILLVQAFSVWNLLKYSECFLVRNGLRLLGFCFIWYDWSLGENSRCGVRCRFTHRVGKKAKPIRDEGDWKFLQQAPLLSSNVVPGWKYVRSGAQTLPEWIPHLGMFSKLIDSRWLSVCLLSDCLGNTWKQICHVSLVSTFVKALLTKESCMKIVSSTHHYLTWKNNVV